MKYQIDLNKAVTSSEEACLVYAHLSKVMADSIEEIAASCLKVAKGEGDGFLTNSLLRLHCAIPSKVEFPTFDEAYGLLAVEPTSGVLTAFKSSPIAQTACLGLISVVHKTVIQDAGQVAMLALLGGKDSPSVLEGSHLAYAELINLFARAPKIAAKIGGSDALGLIYKVIDAYVLERIAERRKNLLSRGPAGKHAIGLLEGMITDRTKIWS